jgi:hypothetical protein
MGIVVWVMMICYVAVPSRIGLLMLGSKVLFIPIPSVILLIIGGTLEAGTVGAVKTVKMSAKLVARRNRADRIVPSGGTPTRTRRFNPFRATTRSTHSSYGRLISSESERTVVTAKCRRHR